MAFVTPTDDSGIMDSEAGHHHKIAADTKNLLVGSVRHSDVVIVDDMVCISSSLNPISMPPQRSSQFFSQYPSVAETTEFPDSVGPKIPLQLHFLWAGGSE